jgi:hypothetical protein
MDGVNRIFEGNGLRILHMDRLSLGQPCIILIVNFGRAFFSTESTGDTLRWIHIARGLKDLNFKIPLLPGDTLHLRKGQ